MRAKILVYVLTITKNRVFFPFQCGIYKGYHEWLKQILFYLFTLSFFFLVFLPFLGPLLRHMEVRRLGVGSELYPLAYATAIPVPNLSSLCDLHHSSQQRQILNRLSKARDQTCILMDASHIISSEPR